jgi:nucleotide-binding universal stress UspA family protein
MLLLLATDGLPGATGAVRLAATLAAEKHAEVSVLRVLQPVPVYGVGPMAPLPLEYYAADVPGPEEVERAVRTSVEAAGGSATWPVRTEPGAAAPTIARAAHQMGASLIVLGLGAHDRVDRWFGSETALRVMQMAHVPVVAVPPAVRTAPARILVAVDFSTFARDALHAAVAVARPGARFEILHVIEAGHTDSPSSSDPAEALELDQLVRRRLADWLAEAGIQLDNVFPHVVRGHPAKAIVDLAESTGAELIAMGAHGHGFLGRLLMGSVSASVLRRAHCSILVAPPREPAVELLRTDP